MFTVDAIKKLGVSHTTLQNYFNRGYIRRERIGRRFDYNNDDIQKIIDFKNDNNTKYFFEKRIPWNRGKTFDKKVRKKMRDSRISFFKNNPERKKECGKYLRNTISKIKKKYLLFSKIEKMRYNPDKPEEKEIQVHCKNHNCSNSKEKGGWFTPTYVQFYERIRQLEKNGNDFCYFYCSEKCKQQCPLYSSKGGDPFKEVKQIYTQEEYQTFREHVLNRDNYKCQYCEKKAEHVHHERPQKLEPFFALDPDYAWSVCKKCHYEKGHKDECNTGNLANKQCFKQRGNINGF